MGLTLVSVVDSLHPGTGQSVALVGPPAFVDLAAPTGAVDATNGGPGLGTVPLGTAPLGG